MSTKRIPVDRLVIGNRFIPEGRKRAVEVIGLSEFHGPTIDVYAQSPQGTSAHILNRYDTVEIVVPAREVDRCVRCGCASAALIHHATANGHDFTTERAS